MMSEALQFPIGSFVRKRNWLLSSDVPPPGPHDVYEVLTNPYLNMFTGFQQGPYLMARRTSATVYPNRVDRLERNHLSPVTREELIAAITDSRLYDDLSDAELVDILVEKT